MYRRTLTEQVHTFIHNFPGVGPAHPTAGLGKLSHVGNPVTYYASLRFHDSIVGSTVGMTLRTVPPREIRGQTRETRLERL